MGKKLVEEVIFQLLIMRRAIVVITIFLIAIGLLGAGLYLYAQFRGVQPAIQKPAFEIARAINTTDMPLSIPDGFRLSIFAEKLQEPRVLVFDPQGTLIVSLTKSNKVVALPDLNGDGQADKEVIVIDDAQLPHGLAFDCDQIACHLFVAETNKVVRYDYEPQTFLVSNKRELFSLPEGGNHFSRTIHIASIDGEKRLLTSVGSSCNVCKEADERRAAVLVSDLEGKGLRPLAIGLRNAVFLETNPVTGDVWVTEMGRDHLGDNLPPEEVNILQDGGNYGWPYCYGGNIHDDVFDRKNEVNCADMVAPHIEFQAHSAPLGLAFVPQTWPNEYAGDLLVAYHGSWNRTDPTGYAVAQFRLDADGKVEGEESFISGWLLPDNRSVGRPVDLVFDDRDDLYISDDKAGVIYRVEMI